MTAKNEKMVAIRKHPRRIANTYQPAQKDPRVPKRVPKINRKIANPQNEPWARLGFPAAQKFKPACKNERKNYIGPKEANDSESTYIRTARRNGNPKLS